MTPLVDVWIQEVYEDAVLCNILEVADYTSIGYSGSGGIWCNVCQKSILSWQNRHSKIGVGTKCYNLGDPNFEFSQAFSKDINLHLESHSMRGN